MSAHSYTTSRDLTVIDRRVRLQKPPDPIAEPQSRGLPQVRLGTVFQESPRRLPLTERRRVGQRCAAVDNRSGRFEVRAKLEQRVEDRDVIGAGRPVQRRLLVWTDETSVDLRAGADQDPHGLAPVGELPG